LALFQLTANCTYDFSAPVIKAKEKRLDGLLEPSQAGEAHYFLELQGYVDKQIYWRVLHQIGWFHEKNPDHDHDNWMALILFLDESHDPGVKTLGPMAQNASDWLKTGVLADLLAKIPTQAPPILNVLRPLAVEDNAQLEKEAPKWADELRQLQNVPQATKVRLEDIFTYFITQKLTHLSRKEIDRMLKLTPLEQTTAGKELIEIGHDKGREEALQEATQKHLLQLLAFRFGVVPKNVKEQLETLDTQQLEKLMAAAFSVDSLDEFLEHPVFC